MDAFLSDTTVALVTTWIVRVAGALLFVAAAWIVAGWAGRLVARVLPERLDATLRGFTARLVRYTILVLALVACLGLFGIQTAAFAALVAAAGLAVGLAFQGTLSHFASGVMLLLFRPFTVGDVISTGGFTGQVRTIDLFTTELDTPDNRRIILPNGTVFGAVIEHLTHHPTRRVAVAVGTDYGADVDGTRRVLEMAAAAVPDGLAEPAPEVVMTALGDSAVQWEVRLWCATPHCLAAAETLTRSVKLALDSAGIGIPYPTMDVHVPALPAAPRSPAASTPAAH